jgi:anti-sigma regulatory factor (Ser/Thr protein kinase)
MTTPAALRATIDLPAIPRSVPTARTVLAQLLSAWAAEPLRENAELLVSELVTNVVRHVGGDMAMQVEVALTAPALRVSVVDASAVAPTRRTPSADGGYGMSLLEIVADRWGVQEDPAGKRVWFELRRHERSTRKP